MDNSPSSDTRFTLINCGCCGIVRCDFIRAMPTLGVGMAPRQCWNTGKPAKRFDMSLLCREYGPCEVRPRSCSLTSSTTVAFMSGKQIGGIVCLILAALLCVSGISSLARADGPSLGDASGLGVSRAVGTFMPSLVVAILGLWLLKRPAPRDPAEPSVAPDRVRKAGPGT